MVGRTKHMVNHLQNKTSRLKTQVENYENQLKRKSDLLNENQANDDRIEEIKKSSQEILRLKLPDISDSLSEVCNYLIFITLF